MKQVSFVFAAMFAALAAQATSNSQIQNIPFLSQRTASVASYQLVDGHSAKARLRIGWIFQRGPEGPGPSTIYLTYSNNDNDPSMTLVEVNTWQPPQISDAVGYAPVVLTAEVPLTALFNAPAEDLGNDDFVHEGAISEVRYEGMQISSEDRFNVEDQGPKTLCVQKQAKLSFAIVACPLK